MLTDQQRKIEFGLAERRIIREASNTDPADRPRAEQAIKEIYSQAGRPEPTIVWFDGPASAAVAAKLCLDSPDKYDIHELAKTPLDELRGLGTGGGDISNSEAGGEMLYWAGVIDAALEKEPDAVSITTEQRTRLTSYLALCRSAGWLFPYEHYALICERPEIVSWDATQKVIHSPTGPARRDRDGHEVYAWNGTVIPKEFISPGATVQDALSHSNLELRRCAAEIIGWDKVIDELGDNVHVIDKDPDPEIGTLLEVDDLGRFVRVLEACSGREFCIRVDADVTTAREGVARSYGETAETYRPERRS